MHRSILLLTFAVFFISSLANCALATNRLARLGIGTTNQLANNLDGVSFKVQKSDNMAIGGLIGLSTKTVGGGYGAGLKAYRILFDEPQMTFYSAALGAILNEKTSALDSSFGFQFDFTLGAEFSFTGLNSLGFSFECGVSVFQTTEFIIKTVGQNFVTASIHFYL